MSADFRTILRVNCVQLQQNIDTENGLKGALLEKQVFVPRIINSIWDTQDKIRRVSELLDQLGKGTPRQFTKFRDSLLQTGQESVVEDYLQRPLSQVERDAVPVSPGGSRPLLTWQISNITSNYCALSEEINCDEGLLAYLIDVFTQIQLRQIRDIEQTCKRNEMMLDLLRRGSDAQYDRFCTALTRNNQEHIVNAYLSRNKPTSSAGLSSSTVPSPCTETPQSSQSPRSQLPLANISSGQQGECNVSSVNEHPIISVNMIFPTDSMIRQVKQLIDSKAAYEVGSGIRGHALIINNEQFTAHATRKGTKVDEENLQNILQSLSFVVTVIRNQTAEDIRVTLKNKSEDSRLQESYVFVVCLLSHGQSGDVYGTDGKPVSLNEIMSFYDGLHCPKLNGKPKLFFIQACQGEAISTGVECRDGLDAVEDVSEVLKKCSLKAPTRDVTDASVDTFTIMHEKSDMALILATASGYAAWRNEDFGSYFVRCLVKVVAQRAHEADLVTILEQIIREMNDLKISGGNKQICQWTGTLQRKVYLLPYDRKNC